MSPSARGYLPVVIQLERRDLSGSLLAKGSDLRPVVKEISARIYGDPFDVYRLSGLNAKKAVRAERAILQRALLRLEGSATERRIVREGDKDRMHGQLRRLVREVLEALSIPTVDAPPPEPSSETTSHDAGDIGDITDTTEATQDVQRTPPLLDPSLDAAGDVSIEVDPDSELPASLGEVEFVFNPLGAIDVVIESLEGMIKDLDIELNYARVIRSRFSRTDARVGPVFGNGADLVTTNTRSGASAASEGPLNGSAEAGS